MAASYRIFGAELSPYSVKVRSYFRYKGIPHEWIPRTPAVQAEFERYARLPLIPLVVTPEDEGMQDSTPIIEALERLIPTPSIYPAEPHLRFLSALIEEYADEWCNKHMFHYRWWYEEDQRSAAERIARMQLGSDASDDEIETTASAIRERMVPRLSFVGSSESTKEQIERSFHRLLDIVEAHLEGRDYLFGERPALADFGLWGQLYQCSTDPTPQATMREKSPRALRWIERMLDPGTDGNSPAGAFETWESLEETLSPLLSHEIGAVFLPWTLANAAALEAGEETFTVEIEGRPFTQQTQKYHARSLAALRAKYEAIADRDALDPILEKTGCLTAIAG